MSDPEPSLAETLAWSMDAEPELLPLLPELFADIEDLGVDAADALALLEGQELGPESRVLDLGCGKGAVALALAEHRGCTVHGIDGMGAFIAHAEDRARSLGLAEQTVFAEADLLVSMRESRDYDAVLLLGLCGILGGPRDTLAALRQVVRPGGLIVFDEAYLTEGVPAEGQYRDCFTREELRAVLTREGDTILAERRVDGPESEPLHRERLAILQDRARELSALHPGFAIRLQDFCSRYAQAMELLDTPLVGSCWLIQRGEA